MQIDEYATYDAVGLAELVRNRDVTAVELLDLALRRLQAVNPKINALAHLYENLARKQIESGLAAGPFAGVPFMEKDLYANVLGAPITNGSRAWLGYVATEDSELVRRHREAGLVIFGSTTSPELGLTPTTENKVQGDTCNPWKLDRISGGSSGGAAAMVAAGVIPMAHASDGGGSIRTPASCCGLFGLKPSRGRIPRGPFRTEGWNGMSVNHAVTRTVRDSAALMDATWGTEPGSRYTAPPSPAGSFLADTKTPPGQLRIAVWFKTWAGESLHPDCRAAVEHTAKICEGLGHTIEEVQPLIDPKALTRVMLPILFTSVRQGLEERGAARGRPVGDDEIEFVTAGYRERAASVTGMDLQNGFAVQERCAIAVARFMAKYDVILSATQNSPPPAHGPLSLSNADSRAYGTAIASFSAMTSAANHTGQPAMSMPLYRNAEGLPIGTMFMGRYGDESTLLRLAAQLEQAQPWPRLAPIKES
jgi:Asp-tRNA(Asn)/Glu-tRNA(Gln) amidotransferase A subunit family amidase